MTSVNIQHVQANHIENRSGRERTLTINIQTQKCFLNLMVHTKIHIHYMVMLTSVTQASYDGNQTQHIEFDELTRKTENGNNQPLEDLFQRQL